MQWVLWMIAVGVLGLAAVAASGRLGELPGTVTDTPRPHMPTGPIAGDDLRGLRFAVVPRGYSMDQVDELLDRLARQLDRHRTPGLAPRIQVVEHPADGPADGPIAEEGSGWAAEASGPTEGSPVDPPDPAAQGDDRSSGHGTQPSGIMDDGSPQPERG